jgi:hypothetical protein
VVTRTNNGGSHRLVCAAAKAGAAAMREREFTEEEEDERSELAKRLNLAQYLVPYGKQRMWPDSRVQLLREQPARLVTPPPSYGFGPGTSFSVFTVTVPL